jgi:hypothetical protein
MQIIEYQKSYAKKELEKIGSKPLFISIAILILFILFLFTGFFSLAKLPSFLMFLEPVKKFFPYIAISLMVFLLFFMIGGEDYVDYLFEQRDRLLMGDEGEERVANFLKRHLDDSFIYIKNYYLPNIEAGDIDGLLVGPKGIILLEVKNYRGLFRVSGRDLYKKEKIRKRYRLYYRNPIPQILEKERFLIELFKQNNIFIKITPIVVLVDGKIEEVQGLKGCWILEYYKLADFIYKLPDIDNWNKTLKQQLFNILGLSLPKTT